MGFVRGNIVGIFNENFLDQYSENNGIYESSIADVNGHPGIVIAGAESWDILRPNVYIVMKGQSLDNTSFDYDNFCKDIENGIATFIDIPGENNTTYMFSGELYTIDMNNIQGRQPIIDYWKPWSNPTPITATESDLISISLCTIKSQEEMLTKNPLYNYFIKTTFNETINNVNMNNYAREELARTFPIINSTTQVEGQFIHPKTIENTELWWDVRPMYANIDENEITEKILNLSVAINNEFEILSNNSKNNLNTTEEQNKYEGLLSIKECNNELSQYNYFDLDIDM